MNVKNVFDVCTARSTSVFVPCWVQSVIRQIFAAASGQEIILQFQQILKKTESLSKVENEYCLFLNEDKAAMHSHILLLHSVPGGINER